MSDAPTEPSDQRRNRLTKARKTAFRLGRREYLPLLGLIAFWSIAGWSVGHADAVRLLAAMMFVRAAQMLPKLVTATPVRSRVPAPPAIGAAARRLALKSQAASVAIAMLLVALIVGLLNLSGDAAVASLVPLVALSLPIRGWRFADPHAFSPYFQIILSWSGVALAALVYFAGLGLPGLALAFGLRDWLCYLIVKLVPALRTPVKRQRDDPLTFAEIARTTVVSNRRVLTYQLTRVPLILLGPFGNAVARTGRGLDLPARIEPYVPHHRGGFAIFALTGFALSAAIAINSGQPAMLVLAGAAAHIGAMAGNVVALWRFLPDRADPDIQIEIDEDD